MVERQQPLPRGLERGARRGAIVEDQHLIGAIASLALVDLLENLPNEWRDRGDRVRQAEQSGRGQAEILETRPHTFAHGPDPLRAGERAERSRHKLRHHLVELTNQTLIGTEDHSRSLSESQVLRPLGLWRRGPTQARHQAEFHGAKVVRQCAHRLFVLADARGGHRLHRSRTTEWSS